MSHFRLAAHLSLAFLIFGSCVWLARDLTLDVRRVGVSADVRRRLSSGLALTGILLAAQIVWGAFVAGLDAGLVFNTFPLMAGRLVPPGLLALDPLMLNFVQNAVAVQWAHRVLGTVLLAAAMGFYFLVRRQGADARSRHLAAVLMALIATQYLLGVLTLVYVVPVGLAVAHQVAALAIFGVWVAWVHHVRHLSVPARMV